MCVFDNFWLDMRLHFEWWNVCMRFLLAALQIRNCWWVSFPIDFHFNVILLLKSLKFALVVQCRSVIYAHGFPRRFVDVYVSYGALCSSQHQRVREVCHCVNDVRYTRTLRAIVTLSIGGWLHSHQLLSLHKQPHKRLQRS